MSTIMYGTPGTTASTHLHAFTAWQRSSSFMTGAPLHCVIVVSLMEQNTKTYKNNFHENEFLLYNKIYITC